MAKVEYKKAYKALYLPKTVPEMIDVPIMKFFVLEGQGNPNEPAFQEVVEALYALSYAVKMSYKSLEVPEGYYDYTVFPLEGVWDLIDPQKGLKDKSNLKYNMMIRQPDFVTEALFERFLEETKKKKGLPLLDAISYQLIEEGTCCQMMHIGAYDDEQASFEKMKLYCKEQGYERVSLTHREIYISDPRKSEPSKMKTVLRFKVKKG